MNTKTDLLAALDDTHARTLALFESLDDAQLAVPYEAGINPPVWELGHTAFFYEFFILRPLDGDQPGMPGYDDIWDSFVIHHRERWEPGVVPDKEATFDYYRRTVAAVRERIAGRELTPREHYLYKYMLFHQHMHYESLTWCRQTLGYPAPPTAADDVKTAPAGDAAPPLGDARIPGGRYPIGMPGDSEHFATTDFAFDNEKPGFEIKLEPYSISKTLVSNGEFLAFVEAEMYSEPEAWSHGGRRWLRATNAGHPAYWRREPDGSWSARRFDRWSPLDPAAPVLHVSYWEAEAFARWAGRRLPTEYEWEAAARGPEGRRFPWGDTPPAPDLADLDSVQFARQPVTAYPDGASPFGCLQMLGTAWEWTSSQFLPYDGFKVDMYPYMSTLQFGDHKVARGGCCATSSSLIRNTYRQAYYPDRNDVFTGFRTCATGTG